MKFNFLTILLITLISFAASYGLSTLAHDGDDHQYPLSLIMLYADGELIPKKQSMAKSWDEIDFEQVNSLSLRVVASDVEIKTSNTNQFSIKVDGQFFEEDFLQWSLKDETLHISLKEEKSKNDSIFSYVSLAQARGDLTLFIPERLFKSVKVVTVSGDIEFERLEAQEVSFTSVSGEIKGDYLKTLDLEIKNVSGDTMLGLATSEAMIRFSTTAGDFDLVILEGELNAEVIFKSLSGELSMELAEGKQEYSRSASLSFGQQKGKIEMKSISGDASISMKR